MAISFVHIPGFNFALELHSISGLIAFHCSSVKTKSNVSQRRSSSILQSMYDSSLSNCTVLIGLSKLELLLWSNFDGTNTPISRLAILRIEFRSLRTFV